MQKQARQEGAAKAISVKYVEPPLVQVFKLHPEAAAKLMQDHAEFVAHDENGMTTQACNFQDRAFLLGYEYGRRSAQTEMRSLEMQHVQLRQKWVAKLAGEEKLSKDADRYHFCRASQVTQGFNDALESCLEELEATANRTLPVTTDEYDAHVDGVMTIAIRQGVWTATGQ